MIGAGALTTALVLTPLMRRWSLKHGFTDRPGERKIHGEEKALGGGVVIYVLTMVPALGVVMAAWWFERYGTPGWMPEVWARHVPGLVSRIPSVLTMVGAGTALHVMGLVDDKRALGPGIKLGVQVVAAVALATVGGIRVGFFIDNVVITTGLSVVWMVVIINAFNFLDNMDGLSAGVGLIAGGMILSAALSGGQVFVSGMLLLLMGALAGFLVYNFAPAKIFMGDAGSLLVGMLLAILSIQTTYYYEGGEGGAWYNTLMPVVVLAVPLYDFLSVTVIRLSQGRSPLVGDKQHFSHRLVRRGMTVRQAVLTIYLATACTGLGATFLHQVSRVGVVLVVVQTLLVVLMIAILERPGRKGEI